MQALTRLLIAMSPMMRGDDVLLVQMRLGTLGVGPTQDGLYGDDTAGMVRKFQSSHGLEVDGIVGPLTWKALFGDAGVEPAPRADPLAGNSLSDQRAMHGYYRDGCRWRLGPDGIEVEGAGLIAFSSPERLQASGVITRFRQEIAAALATHLVPVELVIACICAESSGKPEALRLEPGCDANNPEDTPSRVSVGLMQTLLSTARATLRQPGLRLAELLRADMSILAGAAYMAQQSRQTRFDPPLVAAAYNAGSLRYNSSANNRWKLLQYPVGTAQHVDRFVRSFNAAMALVDAANLPDHVPSLRRMLKGTQAPAVASPPAIPHVQPVAAVVPGTGPYVAKAPTRLIGQVVGDGQCVTYVRNAAGAPHTAQWRRGALAKGVAVPTGTAIATFDPDGQYGNHTDGCSHAAIYLDQDAEGLIVCDQWLGQAVHQRTIRFGEKLPVDDGNAFHVIE